MKPWQRQRQEAKWQQTLLGTAGDKSGREELDSVRSHPILAMKQLVKENVYAMKLSEKEI